MVLALRYVWVIVRLLGTYWSMDGLRQLLNAVGWRLPWLWDPVGSLYSMANPPPDSDKVEQLIREEQLKELSLSQRRAYDLLVIGGRQDEADALLSRALLEKRCSVLPQFPGVDPTAITPTRRDFAVTQLAPQERQLYDYLMAQGQIGAADELLKIVIARAAALGVALPPGVAVPAAYADDPELSRFVISGGV